MTEILRVGIRLNRGLYYLLQTAAIKHNISVNSEIVLRLQDSFGSRNTPRLLRRTDEPITLSVPEAGRRYFGLGRNSSYAAAERGDLPTFRVGKKLRVPIDILERKLEEQNASPEWQIRRPKVANSKIRK